MKDQSEVSPQQGRSRDWIAVDQLVQVMTDNAPDDFERDVVRLAAQSSAGPDPDITGGGPAWKEALDVARHSLQTALLEDLDAKQPVVIDDTHPAQQSINAAIEHTDINEFDRDRLREHLTELFVTQMKEARESERLIISDWMLARAERMGRGGSIIVEEQARALASAAARLRKTFAEEPPL